MAAIMSDHTNPTPETMRENEKLWLYLATKGLCEDYQEWAKVNDPTSLIEVALLFSKEISKRDEEADMALLEMEQRAKQ